MKTKTPGMLIAGQVKELRRRILVAERKISKLQRICPHERVKRVPRSNTGGYDSPVYDRYWYECTCKDCGKYWETPQRAGS